MSENNFSQLCVLQATTLDGGTSKEFEDFFKENFQCRVKFCEEVKTLPDKDSYGNNVPDTGGRSDLFFYVHNDDVMNFSVKRLTMGIRWWEDVIKNGSHKIYPESIIQKYPATW